jgi:hypothetical protein
MLVHSQRKHERQIEEESLLLRIQKIKNLITKSESNHWFQVFHVQKINQPPHLLIPISNRAYLPTMNYNNTKTIPKISMIFFCFKFQE